MNQPVESSGEEKKSSIEEVARKKLGVTHWDRPAIYHDTAEAATDAGFPYWSILVLSGAIATLGLALDNEAVVIGAMLIAPLLAPIMGLGMALAVGDVRLAIQSGISVALSTLAVVLVALLLTALLPFQTFTSEITSRTRPSTLDLGIAVFSGLAGAVVSVTRGKRLSAAIPGVAVAVALIPPLAVAGFSAGAGWRFSFIKGSMLLFGANLGGIVLSSTLVFLLIGMHRPAIVEAARRRHQNAPTSWLARRTRDVRWLPSVETMHSPYARVGLVLAFVIALAIPLTITMGEIARETRVQRAVSGAAELFNVQGRSSVLNIQPILGAGESRALLRVATTEWFGDPAREAFERAASAEAGEPIRLLLEQLPTSAGDLHDLADLLPQRTTAAEPSPPTDLMTILGPARDRVRTAIAALTLPSGVDVAGTEIEMSSGGRNTLRLAYVAGRTLSADAEDLLTRQLQLALAARDLSVELVRVPSDTLRLAGTAADTTQLRAFGEMMHRYEQLHLVLMADSSDAAAADSVVERLAGMGIPSDRVLRRDDDENLLRATLAAMGE